MGRPRKKYKTFHLSVPEEDTEIAEWMSVQFSQSASVRELIRDAICDIGMCDLFTGRSFDRKPGQSGRASGSLAAYEKARAQERKERMQQEEMAEMAAAEMAAEASKPMTAAPVANATNATPNTTEPVSQAPSSKTARKSAPPRKKSSGGGIRLDESVLADFGIPVRLDKDEPKDDNVNHDKIDALKELMDM